MRVQEVYTYPVKSLGGIVSTEAKVLQRGFEFDRRWMLADESGKFISQRVEHQLALLQTEIRQDSIFVRHKIHPEKEISIPLNLSSQEFVQVSVWDDTVQALAVSSELDEWFSKAIGKRCRLVYLPENSQRRVDKKYADNEEKVSLADAFPYLLITQASLDDLNTRLEKPVPMNRFRPNIVIAGTEPFAEDTWLEIQIGEIRFKVAKPCARCVLTTVDQDTAVKGKEPLSTLSKYRSTDGKVLFGQNLIALNEGTIKVNDPVKVIRYKGK